MERESWHLGRCQSYGSSDLTEQRSRVLREQWGTNYIFTRESLKYSVIGNYKYVYPESEMGWEESLK